MDLAHTLKMLLFSGLGAFVLWLRVRYGRSFEQGIQGLVDELLDDFKLRLLLYIGVYVFVGAIIAMVFAFPNTARQAMAAGLGWTALIGGVKPRGLTGAKRNVRPSAQ